jgi:hypothetical protein
MKRDQDLPTMSRFSKYTLESSPTPTANQTISFPKGTRTELWPANSNPGPGTYDLVIRNSLERSPKSSEESPADHNDDKKHLINKPKQILPGPGDYYIETTQTYRFSMGTKPFNLIVKKDSPSPGPGEYNAKFSQSPRAYSITKSARFNESKELKPGPGYYEPNLNKTISFAHTNSPRFSDPKFVAPGPGSYGVPEPDKRIRYKFRSCERIIKRSEDESPGPGTYNYKLTASLPKYSIGRSQRDSGSKSPLPGPGDYELEAKKLQRGISFTHSKRRSLSSEIHNPGPAAYNLGSFSDKYVKK